MFSTTKISRIIYTLELCPDDGLNWSKMLNNFSTNCYNQVLSTISADCQAKILQPSRFNFCQIRSDTEMEGSEKLTGQDKAVLGFIWISSFIYALLNDQVASNITIIIIIIIKVTSKEVNRPCSVREELNSNLALAGVLWGLVKILRSSGVL